ncbi:MAG: hypothetical protein IKP88_16085 [Lachnospiraceae bacterium]|nr:hypothetical protein [Lachnospiraceae bacterium]
MKYKIIFLRHQAYDYYDSLTDVEFISASRVIKKLSEGCFSGILIKKWREKIFETYFKDDNRLFFVIEDDVIYILYACKKTKNKTSKKDTKSILNLYKCFKMLHL